MVKINTHKIGLIVSIICAIHCLALPIFVMFIGNRSHESHNHWIFDLLIFIVASGIMFYSMQEARSRRSPFVIGAIVIGTVFFLSSWLFPEPYNHFLFVAGSGAWFCAHFINYRRGNLNKSV